MAEKHEHPANLQRRCHAPEYVEGAYRPRQTVKNKAKTGAMTYVEPDNGLFAGADTSCSLFFGKMKTCLVIR